MRTLARCLVGLVAGTAIALPANAQSFGTFTLSNTDVAGNGFVTGSYPGFTVTGSNSSLEELGGAQNYTVYSATVLTGGVLNFNWSFSTKDFGPEYDPAGYVLNGLYTQLSDDAGFKSQSGSAAVALSAGDVWGIYVYSGDQCCGEASMRVDIASDVVPEPATMTLLATGLAGMAAARRKKRKS